MVNCQVYAVFHAVVVALAVFAFHCVLHATKKQRIRLFNNQVQMCTLTFCVATVAARRSIKSDLQQQIPIVRLTLDGVGGGHIRHV